MKKLRTSPVRWNQTMNVFETDQQSSTVSVLLPDNDDQEVYCFNGKVKVRSFACFVSGALHSVNDYR